MLERVTAGVALQAVVNALAWRRDVDDVLRTVLAQSRAMLGVSAVYILWRESDQLVLRAAEGFTLPYEDLRLPWGQGLAGWSAAHAEAVAVPDASRDPRFVPLPCWKGPVGALLAVPMRLRGQVTGVIVAFRRERGHFVEVDRWWLDILGSLAAAAIENDRAYRIEERRARQAEVLLALSTVEQTDLSTISQHLADAINRAFGVGKTDIMLHDAERDELVSAGISGGDLVAAEREVGLDRLPLADSNPIVDVFTSGRPYLCRDTNRDPACQRFAALRVRSMLAAPILVGGRARGVLHLATDAPGSFSHDDMAFLILVAERVGVMIERAELRQRQAEVERRQLQAEAREEFLGVVSHELKTPVAVIQAYNELLLRRAEKAGNHSEIDVLNRVGEQAERMLALIEQLLDLQRIEMGSLPLEFSRFDLTDLARRVTEALQQTTTRHTLICESSEPISVRADRRRVEEVLVNLLDNAIKYSPGGGEIRVRISRLAEDGRYWALLQVQDQGVGIAPDEQSRIFGRFYQAGQRLHQGHVGLGLGLYITRELVHRHGGKIWVDSKEGEGSVFAVTLPLDESRSDG